MSQIAAAPLTGASLLPTELPSVDLGELTPWAVFVALLGMLIIFFLSTDQGALSIPAGTAIHEWVHHGPHLLGYPCH